MTSVRVLARELPDHVGSTVLVQGWLHRRRRLASVHFAIIRDRTGLVQTVVKDPATRALLDGLGEETVLAVRGRCVASSQAPGGVEVVEATIEPLGEPSATPPAELWRPELTVTLPTLLDHSAVTWRHPRRQAVWQLAAASMRGYRDAMTSAPSGSASLRTAASPSGSSAGPHAFSAPRTSARSRCSHATCTGWHRDHRPSAEDPVPGTRRSRSVDAVERTP